MTTNSPNPVDGDVQALIERATTLIAKANVFHREDPFYELDVNLLYIALASLTAEIHSFTFEEDPQPLYTTPPAQMLRPVELPGFTYDAEGEPWIHGDEVVDLLMSLGYEVKS
ncbi:hypothetical protein [Pantoea ananatis]